MLSALARLLRALARNPQPAPPPHVTATQDRHWRAKRRYADTHARLARELGIEWRPGKRR